MVKLFFSYSHKDEDLRNLLEKHLASLKRQGVISSWHDRRITAGSDLDNSISSEIESSQLILLLVSAHFISSDYCYEKEMKQALEKHVDGTAVVIPVILRPCDWESSPFGKLRVTPTDGKAVSMYANQDEALTIVAKDIREAAMRFQNQDSSPTSGESGEYIEGTSAKRERSSNLRIRRKFDDHECDEFLEDSYEYIARYFEGSLQELSARNPQIKTRFKRLNETSFTAAIYDNGERVTQCAVWYDTDKYRSSQIAYSSSGEAHGGYNESLSVINDGYVLLLKPLGMQMSVEFTDKALSQEGAAEYYWSILIRPLQV